LLAGGAPRRPADDDLQRRLAVFRDRRDEIRADAAAGRLSQALADQAQDDLLRQMTAELPAEWLADADGGAGERTSPAPGRTRAPWLAGLVVAVALPLLAFGVYRTVGAPDIALAQMEGGLPTLADTPQGRFDALVAEIEARL